MKRMRWLVILFILWLVGLVASERFDIDHQPVLVNMAWFVYVIAIASVVVLLSLPLRRAQFYMLLFWMFAVYMVCKALDYRPIFWGVGKYVTVSEVAVLFVTALFGWRIGSILQQFEEAVEAISLPEGRTPLLPYPQIQERLDTEVGRARRLHSPLSVVTIDLDPATLELGLHNIIREVQAAMMRRYVQVRVGLLLKRCIRETDVVARHTADGRFVLVAPGTSAEQAEEMLKRLAHQVEEQTGIRFRYGVADFPAAALTPEQLLELSAQQVSSVVVPDEVAVSVLTDDILPSYTALPVLSEQRVSHSEEHDIAPTPSTSHLS